MGDRSERLRKLIAMIDAFLEPGALRGTLPAGEIEAELDDLLGDQEEFEEYVTALAQYSPAGGQYLYGEAEIVSMLTHLRTRLASMAEDP